MKTFKKYISLLLVMLMITTMLPFTAYADTIKQDANGSDDNVTWSYTANDDTLYMNGENILLEDYGAYPTFIDGELQNITFSHLIIGKDVRSIKLKSGATQPDGDTSYYSSNYEVVFETGSVLNTIGSYAFYGSTATSMTLPESVTTINSNAFCYARQLKYIDMSAADVKTLPANCFAGCTSLVEAKLPEEITTIPQGCFENLNRALTTVQIPDTVTTIEASAFNSCRNLQLDKLPSSLNKVGDSAFYDCASVSFEVGKKVLSIAAYAFSGSGVRKVNLEVTDLARYAFYNCRQLTEAYISASGTINSYAFESCSALERVAFSGNVVNISAYAFDNCMSLTSVDFSATTRFQKIGEYAFSQCESLKTVKLPDTVNRISKYAFDGCKSLEKINLNNTQITFISEACFRNTALKNVKLPSTVTMIDKIAFVGCKNIEKFVLPATVTTLKANVFTNSKIDTLAIYSNNLNISSCGLQSATIGTIKGNEYSTAKTFATQNNIPFVLFGTDDDETDSSAFSGTIATDSIDNATWYITEDKELVIEGNSAIKSTNLYDEDGISIPVASAIFAYDIEKITFSEGITSIPNNFAYVDGTSIKSLKSISLPSTLKSIGTNAFRGADLDSLVIPENCITIGDAAFQESGLAGGVTFNSPITKLSAYLFFGCDFESFTVPETVQTLGNHSLNNCFNLKNVVIPPSVINFDNLRPVGYKVVRTGGIDYWFKLEDVVITCIFGTPAFEYASLYSFETDYTLDNNYIKGYISTDRMADWFYAIDTKTLYVVPFGNSALTATNIDLDNTATHRVYFEDGSKVQKGDLDVDTVCLNNRVVQLMAINKKTSFLEVFNPKKIEFSDSMKKFAANAFTGLDRIEEIIVPKNLTTISQGAFDGCPFTKIDFSNSQRGWTIEPGIFQDNKNLEIVITGGKFRSIKSKAFKNCSSLKYIDLTGVTNIEGSAFYQCTSLEYIEIPDTVLNIYGNAFQKCTSVRYVNMYAQKASTKAFCDLPFCDTINIYSNFKPTGTAFSDIGYMTSGVHLSFLGNANSAYLNYFGSSNITQLYFGKNVTNYSLNSNTVSYPKLKKIIVEEGNERLFTYNDCLYRVYNDDPQEPEYDLLLVPRQLTQVDILDKTVCIEHAAFAHGNINNVTVPEGVTEIDSYAFYLCKELRKINLPTTLEFIDSYAFCDCEKLRIVSIPSCEEIANEAFAYCTNLGSILLPSNLYDIWDNAFIGCSALKCVVIPENCSGIADYSFSECYALEDVYMFETDISKRAFIDRNENLTIHTMVGSVPYQRAIEYGINVEAFTDEDVFRDECAMMEDIFEGYLGFCGDEHGDIQYLTVYEPTCTQDGYIIGVCEYCSVILEEIHITAEGHDYANTVSIPATATTQAVDKYECKNCGDVYTVFAPPLESNNESIISNVKGKVVIANDNQAAKGSTPLANVDVMLAGERIATTGADGKFSIQLETGVYELTLHYNYGFDRVIYVVVTEEYVDIGTVPLVACDWNRDGTIDDGDYQLFRFVIASSKGDPAYLDFVDMNNDGKINVKDLAYMNNVKGLCADTFVYPEIIVGVE